MLDNQLCPAADIWLMQHARQGFQKRVKRSRIAAEIAANKVAVLGAIVVQDGSRSAEAGLSAEQYCARSGMPRIPGAELRTLASPIG